MRTIETGSGVIDGIGTFFPQAARRGAATVFVHVAFVEA